MGTAKRAKRRPRKLPDDVAIVHGPTDDGQGARLMRLRKGEISLGEIRPAVEGKPVGQGELVRLTPLAKDSPVCEVEVLHAAEPAREAPRRAHGPARVATETYRRNWSSIFGAGRASRTDELPN